MLKFALCAGGRRFHDAASDAGGSGGQPAQGGGDPNDAAQKQFDNGYGKGMEKGRREAEAAMLRELGVNSPDEAKALAKLARDAETAAKKAAEEQGQFKGLYESEKAARAADAARLAELTKQVESFQAGQKAEVETLSAKLTDDQKALLEGLPLDKQVQLARVLAGASGQPVGAAAGKGQPPAGDDQKTLEAYAKKGWANMTEEERKHATQLQAKAGSMTLEESGRLRR